MKKYVHVLMLAACFFTLYTQAQENGINTSPRYLSTQKKYTFAIQPFQWINWGWRFDFETRLGDGPGWLQFGPAVYSASDNDHYFYHGNNYWHDRNVSFREPFSKLNGAGLDISYKHFFDPNRSVYFASGLSYARFNIDYVGTYGKWNEYTEDGLQYHEYLFYQKATDTQHINRISVNQYIGFQPPSRHAFLFDMFVGISYRHAISDKDKPQFDEHTFSYGFTGFVFMTGIRLGFGIKK